MISAWQNRAMIAENDYELCARRNERLVAEIEKFIKAWEALPEGKYPPSIINKWLTNSMEPAINSARDVLK